MNGPKPPRNGPGVLEIGVNEWHEVVLNLPHDMTGHIVFTAEQAINLAKILTLHAKIANRQRKVEAFVEEFRRTHPEGYELHQQMPDGTWVYVGE